MAIKNALCIAVLLLCSATKADEVIPQLATPYSADFRQLAGEFEMTGKVWVDGDRQRVQSMMFDEVVISLVHRDTDTVYLYTVGEDVALALDYTPELAGSTEVFHALNPAFDGRETISGETALRFSIDGQRDAARITGNIWLSPDGILLRAETESELGGEIVQGLMEVSDIQRGSIDSTLFELPEGMSIERR